MRAAQPHPERASTFFPGVQEDLWCVPASGEVPLVYIFPEALSATLAALDQGPSFSYGPLIAALKQRSLQQMKPFLNKIRMPEKLEGKLTGYYSPLLQGSLLPTTDYFYPFFGLLPDVWHQKTRADIEAAVETLSSHALCWGRDIVDAFFFDVQGSGMISIDGKKRWLQYAGRNEHPYKSVGLFLQKTFGEKADFSTAEKMKAFLKREPHVSELLHQNPSKIFYRWADQQGAITTAGVCAASFTTIAVDPAYIPLGSLVAASFVAPSGELICLLTVAVDTGSAIQGEHRVDLYTGVGEEAGRFAGCLNQPCQIQRISI
ncbi:MltA domain-containing protein [Alphaproteobacteria bacterium]|nr:MltA domain-containing protein [Alphaproteobacteria bacterium]